MCWVKTPPQFKILSHKHKKDEELNIIDGHVPGHEINTIANKQIDNQNSIGP